MFSKYPVIVYAVDTTALTADWNPETFPNLIVIHTNPISNMNAKQAGVSFNFNKFRSMLLRIKVGIQLDADMIMAKHCDRAAASTSFVDHFLRGSQLHGDPRAPCDVLL